MYRKAVNWKELIAGLEDINYIIHRSSAYLQPFATEVKTQKYGVIKFDTSKISYIDNKPGYIAKILIENKHELPLWVECTADKAGAKICKGSIDFCKEAIDNYLGMFSANAISSSIFTQATKQWPMYDCTSVYGVCIFQGVKALQALMGCSYMQHSILHKGRVLVAVYGEYDVITSAGELSGLTNGSAFTSSFVSKFNNGFKFNERK